MDGWGFDAPPILGVSFLHGTYLTTFRLGFVSQAALVAAQTQTGWPHCDDLTLEILIQNDLICSKCGYYGDFELYALPVIT
jgi:hypothetical protein